MKPNYSLALLEQLLSGHNLTPDEIDGLLINLVREDQYIEYKSGKILEQPEKQVSDTIREYISAFANSDGGIFIIGIDAPDGIPREITGCKKNNENLSEWVARCLTPIASYFYPSPRFQMVSHPKGEIFVVTAPRSMGMVPCYKAGKLVYYIRLHDQTLQAPEYLIADILLGRRQKPIFDINDCKLLNFRKVSSDNYVSMDFEFNLKIRLENSSIVWAENSRWGIVSWVTPNQGQLYLEYGSPSQSLLSFISIHKMTHDEQILPRKLMHYRAEISINKPFDMQTIGISLVAPLRLPNHNEWLTYKWRAALYLTSKDNLPIWYQIDLAVNEKLAPVINTNGTELTIDNQLFSISKVIATPPIIDWEGL